MNRLLPFLLLLLSLFFQPAPAMAREMGEEQSLTILADSSLIVPLNLIARDYAIRHKISITTAFSSTKEQIEDIEAGEDANVIITAKAKWLDMLQQKGLIDVFSRTNVAGNRLVLAGTQFNIKNISLENSKSLRDFTNTPEDFILLLGDPEFSSEGSYAMEGLSFYRLAMMLEPHYTFIGNMYQLINSISRYESLGVVFRTDALLFPDIRELDDFASESHRPITYQAAVVAGENMGMAREFIAYLTSTEARKILRTHGFEVEM